MLFYTVFSGLQWNLQGKQQFQCILQILQQKSLKEYDLNMIEQNYCKKNIDIQLSVDIESDVTKFFNIPI